MTDKVQKIREEVERLYNQSLADENRQAELGLKSAACTSYGKSKVCKELLSFIDSMQEEPVSIDFEQELYKAFGQVKDFTLGMRIAKWFYDIGRKHQEPVSEDLEDFALQYAGHHAPYDDCMQEVEDAFRAGAKWQKEQDKQWLAEEHKNIFAKGRDSMKQQMMKEACDWLKSNIDCSMWIMDFKKHLKN